MSFYNTKTVVKSATIVSSDAEKSANFPMFDVKFIIVLKKYKGKLHMRET